MMSGRVGCCETEAVFVFGSNLAGRHGAGAAKHARLYHGAVYGHSAGMQGRCYAIPTKDERLRTLPLDDIRCYVGEFLAYARVEDATEFYVTSIGCGLAGYSEAQIVPMFKGAPPNCIPPDGWTR
jgi:hypothetical protein